MGKDTCGDARVRIGFGLDVRQTNGQAGHPTDAE